jgi:hypothetical protein
MCVEHGCRQPLLIAGVAHNAHAANGSIGPCSVSNALQISSELQKPVDRMLRVSPTFLSQYCRIVRATGLLVGVRMDIELMERRLRARSVVRRYRSGLVVVAVAIAPGPRNEEWIAHEFEHILEQLDGLDLSKLARMRARQVWFSGPALIETHRAIEAGRVVRDEVRKQPRARPPAIAGISEYGGAPDRTGGNAQP